MRVMAALALFAAAPVYAALTPLTEDFETNPFGLNGNWHRSGDVAWTGGGPHNDYVMLGQRILANNDSRLWRLFTAPVDGEYSVSFDYRFVGIDLSRCADDKVFVQIGIGSDPLIDVFTAASSVDLTGGLFCPGSWENITTPPPVVDLKAGQEYWLGFQLKEVCGWWTPITSLHLDNIGVTLLKQTPDITPIPEPATVTIMGLAGLLLRRRRA
jgi:hypothetical protein